MPRKRILQAIPALADLFEGFSGFSNEPSRQLALIAMLRKAGRRLQKARPQPFYSMRDIAAFFQVPLRTAAVAYESLEQEGLLNRIRGSQTLLAGRVIALRKPVRGVIGIPAWMRSLLASPQAWEFHKHLEEKLRETGFVADTIFFHDEEQRAEDVLDRLLRHRLDYIIWHAPPKVLAFPSLFLSLKDQGVRQILIHGRTSFPCPIYTQIWKTAFHEMATTWRSAGIRSAIILEPSSWAIGGGVKILASVLSEYQISADIMPPDVKKVLEHVHRRRDGRSAVAFINLEDAYSICNREPLFIEQAVQAARIAFCRGAPHVPYFEGRPGKVDVVCLPAKERAQRIVEDLCHGKLTQNGVVHRFRAIFHPQVDLSALSQIL